MTDMPDEPPAFVPDWWSAAMRKLYGRYYHPSIDIATLLAAGLTLFGVLAVYNDIDGSWRPFAGAAIVVLLFTGLVYSDERRWRA